MEPTGKDGLRWSIIWSWLWIPLTPVVIIAIYVLLHALSFFHPMYYIPCSDPQELYQHTTQIVYFERDSCTSCEAAREYVRSAADNNKIEILHFDTDKFRDHALFSQVLEDFRVTEVPYMVQIQNGMYVDGMSLISESGQVQPERILEFLNITP